MAALWNQVWSFSGHWTRPDVNQLFLRPFPFVSGDAHEHATVQSESTAAGKASDQKWTMPTNFLIGILSSFGTFPASYQLGVGMFPVHPDVGPSWKTRRRS